MSRTAAWGVALALTARAGLAAPTSPRPAQRVAGTPADSLVSFRLPDQFGTVHDAGEYRGRAFYLIGTARAGQASATQWARTLRAVAPAPAGRAPDDVVAIADLSAVPRLLRGVVRGHFSKNPERPVLLDWDGAVARRLAFDPGRCTVEMVDAGGRAVLRTSTLTTDTTAIAEFARRADAAVRAAPAP